MTPELLPEWLPAYQVLKVADELGMSAERQLGLRDPPLSAGASTDPAGLTARARPEARPGTRGELP
jgi:hypothetical protein